MISLNRALEKDLFTLEYQPKIKLNDCDVLGFEALLRLKDRKGVPMNISHLIKIAENSGFITEISKWVIKNAVEQLKIWKEEGIEINVSINLSHKDFRDLSIVEYAKDQLKRFNIDPNKLEFELTERGLIDNHHNGISVLNSLKKMGSKLSLDDYGIGYNSLMNMVELPLDYIKLDKSIIDNIAYESGKSLVQDLICLIHNLGKEIIAEGVETVEQYELLKAMGCDYIQGYYVGKPMKAEEVLQYLLSSKL